jgi:hypothetical protein
VAAPGPEIMDTHRNIWQLSKLNFHIVHQMLQLAHLFGLDMFLK